MRTASFPTFSLCFNESTRNTEQERWRNECSSAPTVTCTHKKEQAQLLERPLLRGHHCCTHSPHTTVWLQQSAIHATLFCFSRARSPLAYSRTDCWNTDPDSNHEHPGAGRRDPLHGRLLRTARRTELIQTDRASPPCFGKQQGLLLPLPEQSCCSSCMLGRC